MCINQSMWVFWFLFPHKRLILSVAVFAIQDSSPPSLEVHSSGFLLDSSPLWKKCAMWLVFSCYEKAPRFSGIISSKYSCEMSLIHWDTHVMIAHLICAWWNWVIQIIHGSTFEQSVSRILCPSLCFLLSSNRSSSCMYAHRVSLQIGARQFTYARLVFESSWSLPPVPQLLSLCISRLLNYNCVNLFFCIVTLMVQSDFCIFFWLWRMIFVCNLLGMVWSKIVIFAYLLLMLWGEFASSSDFVEWFFASCFLCYKTKD